jgi:hypothetical protein
MPTTERTTERSTEEAATNGHSAGEHQSPLVDQVLLTSADAATRGVASTRRIAEGALSAVDVLVRGGFDLAEQVTKSTLLTDVALKGIAVGRQSWAIGVDTSREVLAVL